MAAPVENRIFVSGIQPAISLEDVREHFSQFGNLVDLYMPRVPGGDRYKGIAYVSFETKDSQELALQFQPHLINGFQVSAQVCLPKGAGKGGRDPAGGPQFASPAGVSHFASPAGGSQLATPAGGSNFAASGGLSNFAAPPVERLFITGVPGDVPQAEVQEYFAQFGTWSDIYMPRGNNAAGHKGICFISFNSKTSVQQVLATAPHMIRGQPIVVDQATPREQVKGGCKGGLGFGGGMGAFAGGVRAGVTGGCAGGYSYKGKGGSGGFGGGCGGLGGGCGCCGCCGGFGGGCGCGSQAPGGAAVIAAAAAAAGRAVTPNGFLAQPYRGAPAFGGVGGAGLPPAVVPAFSNVGGAGFPPAEATLPGRLFLTKMSPEITKDDLTTYFSQFGVLNDVYIPPGGKLIAFVGFEDAGAAELALQQPAHEVLPGCSVQASAAVERPGKGAGKVAPRVGPY